jgi:hypothetical protein
MLCIYIQTRRSMSSAIDFDVNNYTVLEIFDMFKLNSSTCSAREVADRAQQLANDLSDHSDAALFIYQCREKLDHFVRDRIKPYNSDIISQNNEYQSRENRNNRNNGNNGNNTLQLNYSTNPTNYDAFHRESVVHDAGEYAKRNIAQVTNTYDYKFPTGVLNPIERRVIKRLLSMDTLFRMNYINTPSTNASWVLPYPVENVVSMKIASVQIPNMWYAFSDAIKSNRFTVMITGLNVAPYDPTEVYTNDIVIPEGNYLSDEFMECMNNLFKNTANGMEFFQFAISSHTSKTMIFVNSATLTCATSPDFEYVVIFDDPVKYNKYLKNGCIYSDCDIQRIKDEHEKEYYNANIKAISRSAGWMMGFKQLAYRRTWQNERVDMISQVPITTYHAFLESESSYGSSIWNYLYVDVDDYNKNFITNSIIAQTGDSYLGFNILGRITVSSGQLTIINDNAGDMIFKMREYLGPVRLEKLTIRLLDKFGNVIHLNGNDYSIALELQVLYN